MQTRRGDMLPTPEPKRRWSPGAAILFAAGCSAVLWAALVGVFRILLG